VNSSVQSADCLIAVFFERGIGVSTTGNGGYASTPLTDCGQEQSRRKPPPNLPTGCEAWGKMAHHDAKWPHIVMRGALYVGVKER